MKYSELVNNSRQNLSKNGLFSIIIMFFAALICAAFLFINLLFSDLFLFIVPLIVLPTMFSFQRAIIALREEKVLSFSLVFIGYRQYFTERFASTYYFFKNLLKLLIIYLAVGFTSMIVVNLLFYNYNFLGFQEIFKEIYNSNMSYEVIEELYNKHAYFFSVYMMAISLPPLYAVSIMGLFFYSISGHSFFLRLSGLKYNGAYFTELFKRVYKKNRWEFLKYYFSLNWPLYLLFFLGLFIGGYVGSLFLFDFGSIFTFGLAFAVFMAFGIFGSIYFANKETIYFAFIDKIQKEDHNLKIEITRRFQELTQKSQELQDAFKEFENVEEEEEQKNDSDEPY